MLENQNMKSQRMTPNHDTVLSITNEMAFSKMSKYVLKNLLHATKSTSSSKDTSIKTIFKGTLMQIWKSPYVFVFLWKYYPENFAFLILGILELFTRKFWEMFVYKHTETIEHVKN